MTPRRALIPALILAAAGIASAQAMTPAELRALVIKETRRQRLRLQGWRQELATYHPPRGHAVSCVLKFRGCRVEPLVKLLFKLEGHAGVRARRIDSLVFTPRQGWDVTLALELFRTATGKKPPRRLSALEVLRPFARAKDRVPKKWGLLVLEVRIDLRPGEKSTFVVASADKAAGTELSRQLKGEQGWTAALLIVKPRPKVGGFRSELTMHRDRTGKAPPPPPRTLAGLKVIWEQLDRPRARPRLPPPRVKPPARIADYRVVSTHRDPNDPSRSTAILSTPAGTQRSVSVGSKLLGMEVTAIGIRVVAGKSEGFVKLVQGKRTVILSPHRKP